MRKVGNQIREAMNQSERLGRWAIASELTTSLGLQPTLATKVCRRAVIYGLAEADDSAYPARFRALPGWRARANVAGISKGIAAVPMEPNKSFERAHDRLPERIINSVFSLGAI